MEQELLLSEADLRQIIAKHLKTTLGLAAKPADVSFEGRCNCDYYNSSNGWGARSIRAKYKAPVTQEA
jgi:hypothetical protein